LPEANADHTDGPFATLAHARDAVRQRKQTGDLPGPVIVYLRGGRYSLAAPLQFTPADSAPVMYAAYPGETPILDGGRRVSGWQVEQVNGRTAWVADCSAMHYFRQLFVNGERRCRARLPKVEIVHARNGHPETFYRMAGVPDITFKAELFEGSHTFIAAPGDIQAWPHLTDVEVVALHYWIEERMPIASFDPATGLVISTRRSTFALKDDYVDRWAKYYLDNVFAALTEPGEWFLERRQDGALKLYYLPCPGETPDSVEVFVPQVEQLLRLSGDPDAGRYVEFLRFEGLTFEHADWRQPTAEGDPNGQASPGEKSLPWAAAAQGAYNVPGAIELSGARYCAIENCVIRHVGGYGVELRDGCRGNRFVGNQVFDLGAGGFLVNGADADGPLARRTGENRFTDNHVHAGGRVFHSGIGFLLRHSFGNVIAHNHIHDFFYSGVSCGWVWGYAESVSKNNRIEYNHIHDLGHGWLSDMGGVYLLGIQPGTVVRNNLIHDIEKSNYGGWALYTDEGSTGVVLENNVCCRTNAQLFHQHYGHENLARNNIFAFGGEAGVALSRYDGVNAFTFERNIVITDQAPLFIAGYANDWRSRSIISDLNLFWSASGAPLTVQSSPGAPRLSFAGWQALGYDTHSLVADPKIKSLEADSFDWTLATDSPALALGFRPIDLSSVGPRPQEERD
jgi:hypothetical protein